MASVKALDGALDFEHRSLPARRFFSGLTAYWNAIREGNEAAHAYNELLRRGVPHEEAVVRVFEDHFGRR